MSVENTSDEIGTNVVTVAKTTATTARWTYDNDSSYLNDGRATLTNVSSPTGKMLDVEGMNIDIWSHTGSGCQYFSIYRIEDYDAVYAQGLYVIRYNKYYVTQDSDYNVKLTESPTEGSYWSFMKVNKGTASMVSFDYTYSDNSGQYNSSTNSSNFLNCFNGMSYTSSSVINTSVDDAFTKLQNSDIFLYSGHGNNSRLVFCDDKDSVYAKIVVNISQNNYQSQPNVKTIDSLSHNQLSDARCVFYLGCNTGLADGNVNLVDSTYDMGAHFVFGVCEETYCEVDQWLPHFFGYLMDGQSVGEAINSADDDVRDNMYTVNTAEHGVITIDGLFERYFVGDTSQVLYI